MAELEEAVYSRLSTFAGLTALVGTRIFPDIAPQGAAYPRVVFQRAGTRRPHAFGVDAGLAHVPMDVVAYDTTKAGVLAVVAQLRAALRRWKGTFAGVIIQDTLLDNEFARPEGALTPLGTGTPGVYGHQLALTVHHEEP